MTENVTRTEDRQVMVDERHMQNAVEGFNRASANILQMGEAIAGMAGKLRDIGSQLQALQLKVAMLEKVTPMQAKDLNGRIRERACDLEMGYGLPEGSAQKLMAAIRRAVRMETGARSTRDVARCDYPVVCGLIGDWEDYETITKMRMEDDHD